VSAAVPIRIDGRAVQAAADASVAAVLLNAGVHLFRRSVTGEARAPLCGMGICFECRVTIDGVAHRRACLEPVRAGMEIATGD
jgi:D-hydroxyproline dehydrogenase subunit gamma